MVIELKTRATTAKIDTLGAELVSIQDVFGMEYIWQKDSRFWAQSSPLLFPIVGGLRNDRVMIEGKEYQIPKHGFARDMEFRVVYQSDSSAVLSLSYTDQTLAVYPYRFQLSVSYTLEEEKLIVRYTVLNTDARPMDFCLGAHPGFNVPLGDGCFEDWCLEFEQPETGGCPRFDLKQMQFDMQQRIDWTQGGNRLMLQYPMFENDAILFDHPASHRVKLHSIRTGRGVEVDYASFDFIAFWTPIGLHAPFLCVEPWNGMAACSDEGNEFAKKRGARHLEPGEQAEFKMEITLL